MASALFFQDGGIPGGISNIGLLLLIGGTAEQVLRRWDWIIIYTFGGLVAEAVALSWQPAGAGNSVATCSLAGFLTVTMPTDRARWPVLIIRLCAGALIVALLLQRNIHGVGAIAGALFAAFAFRSHITNQSLQNGGRRARLDSR